MSVVDLAIVVLAVVVLPAICVWLAVGLLLQSSPKANNATDPSN